MLPSKPCLMALAAGVMLASGVTGARAADQKLFVWAEAVEPSTVDPAKSDVNQEMTIARNVFDHLTNFDLDHPDHILPALATSWTEDEDFDVIIDAVARLEERIRGWESAVPGRRFAETATEEERGSAPPSLLAPYRPLRVCSLLAPCRRAKSLATRPAPIYEMGSKSSALRRAAKSGFKHSMKALVQTPSGAGTLAGGCS